MSPTSYRAAPPRIYSLAIARGGVNVSTALSLTASRRINLPSVPPIPSGTLLASCKASEETARMSQLYVFVLIVIVVALAGRCTLSRFPCEDQGRLPGRRPLAACLRPGAHAVHFVDRRRVALCRGRKCLQKRLCRALAAGRRMARPAAHLLHCAPRSQICPVHAARSARGSLQPDRARARHFRHSLCLCRNHQLSIQGRRQRAAPHFSRRRSRRNWAPTSSPSSSSSPRLWPACRPWPIWM